LLSHQRFSKVNLPPGRPLGQSSGESTIKLSTQTLSNNLPFVQNELSSLAATSERLALPRAKSPTTNL